MLHIPHISCHQSFKPTTKLQHQRSPRRSRARRIPSQIRSNPDLHLPHHSDPLSQPSVSNLSESRAAQQSPVLWSWQTISFVSAVCISVPIHLLTFAHLGKDFTFRITKPKRLVTTGIYRYVQHPGYASFFLLHCAVNFFLGGLGGVLACWLPAWYVSKSILRALSGMLQAGVPIVMVIIRIRDEEEVLRREFGKEWEAYHQNTKRFLPRII